MTSVLVVSPDRIGEEMAGPAIRAFEIARALARSHEVTLAGPPGSTLPEGGELSLAEASPAAPGFLELARAHAVVVAQFLPGSALARLLDSPVRIVVDLYDPRPLEVLERFPGLDPRGLRRRASAEAAEALAYLASADFVICASERQRDLWVGGLMVSGLIDPERYSVDPTYRSFVDVVPFGVPDEPPGGAGEARGGTRWPGIEGGDRVVVWAGGAWDWLDPLTAVRAVERAGERIDGLKLLFLGTGRPPAGERESFPAMTATSELGRYVRERGLEGSRVLINERWVPYGQRAGYLLAAELGITTHRDHLEARYAFRTRVLDYLWAGLPVVATEGDVLAELIERRALGRTVPAEDPDALADAIVSILADPDELAASARRAAEVAAELRWSRVVAPLERFCLRPEEPFRPAGAGRRASRLVRASRARKLGQMQAESGLGGIAREAFAKLRRQAGRD